MSVARLLELTSTRGAGGTRCFGAETRAVGLYGRHANPPGGYATGITPKEEQH